MDDLITQPYKNSLRAVRGFTMIELVVVITIIGILGVEVVSLWQASGINLGAQANQVANDIRYTQSLAMTNGQRYYFIVQSSTSYQIRNSAGTAITMARGNTTVTLQSGITFGTLTNLPSSLIAFDGKGTPYTTSTSPGTALAATASIPLTAGSITQTITILAGTGRVMV